MKILRLEENDLNSSTLEMVLSKRSSGKQHT